ncbi:MAG: septum formation initiator family protein [Oscillospiraceae bacterium]|nr:septum formation initiator family protein [Oscillospiraceae bacterium]
MNTKESLIRIIFLSLLLYSMLSLAASGRELEEALAKKQELEKQLGLLTSQKQALQDKLSREISEEEIEQLARQRLGLVKAGEKIFYFTDREGRPWNWQ